MSFGSSSGRLQVLLPVHRQVLVMEKESPGVRVQTLALLFFQLCLPHKKLISSDVISSCVQLGQYLVYKLYVNTGNVTCCGGQLFQGPMLCFCKHQMKAFPHMSMIFLGTGRCLSSVFTLDMGEKGTRVIVW